MSLHVEVAHRRICTHHLVVRHRHRLLSIHLRARCIVGRDSTFHFDFVRLSNSRIVASLDELGLLLLDRRLAALLRVRLRLRLRLELLIRILV